MTKNIYQYINLRRALFGYSWISFLQGFLQNVLAKIISINYITKNLSYATEVGDTKVQYYDTGRLIRVMLSFDPIEVIQAEDDWYFDNDMDLED